MSTSTKSKETDANSAEPAAPQKLFDPSRFTSLAADIAEMEVRDPETNAPTGWKWQFAGPSHPVAIAKADKDAKEALAEVNKIRRDRGNGKKYKPEGKTPDQARREGVEDIVDLLLGWSGAVVEYSRETAIEMLLDPRYNSLLRQVNDFLDEETAFIKTSASS